MIQIADENIYASVGFFLNKIENNFSEEELNSVSEIHIKRDIKVIEELLLLNGLVSIYFKNIAVSKELVDVLNKLNKLELVSFDDCRFNVEPSLFNINSLTIIKGDLLYFDFLENLVNLKNLSLEYLNVNNLEFINNLKGLKVLSLRGSKLPNKIGLDKTNIEILELDSSDIEGFDYVFFPNTLKVLYVSKVQFLLNSKYLKDLKNYGVEIKYGEDTEIYN